jgi:hypothetical protein
MENTSPKRLRNLLRSLPTPVRNVNRRQSAAQRDVRLARLYGRHYYDGTRLQGYGGYIDDGRWIPVAKDIASDLNYSQSDLVCEIGCAKAFLLNSLISQKLVASAFGVDASLYALRKAKPTHNVHLVHANAIRLPFADKSIHHMISINSLHNFLDTNQVQIAISEIQRVTIKTAYIRIAAFETNEQKECIDRWATAGRAYFHVDQWLQIFEDAGYSGFYDWWHPDPSVCL